jgi:uncharacterized repeat protein (TIGR01451 family)
VAIDPATEAIQFSIPVGPEPQRLAISDDGFTLYVGLLSDTIQIVDLDSRSVVSSFSVGVDQDGEPMRAEDMAVQPGQAGVLAVSLRHSNPYSSPRHVGVAIFNTGVMRPTRADAHIGSNRIVFSTADPSRIYGVDNETSSGSFFRLQVAPTGVTIVDETRDFVDDFFTRGLQFRGGRVYTNRGEIIAPEPPQRLDGFDLPTNLQERMGAALALDATRAWFVTFSAEVFGFDLMTGAELIHHLMPPAYPPGERLVRWGASGLAYNIAGRESPAGIMVVRDIDNPGTADVGITMSENRDPTTQGEVLDYHIVVRNHGPETAGNIVLRDTLPEGTNLRYLTVGCCFVTPEDSSGVIVRLLGTLGPGDTVAVHIGLEPTALGIIRNGAGITTGTHDPNPVNNLASERTEVLPPGWDHIDLWSRFEPFAAPAPGTFHYRIVVGNRGPAEATGFFLYHYLYALGIEPTSASTPAGTCDVSPWAVNCTIPSLAAGDSLIIDITALASAGGQGRLISEARSWTQTDGNRENDDDTLDVVVAGSSQAALDTLELLIEDAGLPPGLEKRMLRYVDLARTNVENGQLESACEALRGLGQAVARLPEQLLAPLDARRLAAATDHAEASIGCPAGRRVPAQAAAKAVEASSLTLRSSSLEPIQRLELALPAACMVRADVLDVAGRVVRTLEEGPRDAGRHELVWDGRGNNSERGARGVYFVRVIAGDSQLVRRVLVLR